jgi:hypothetical protein
MFPATHWGIGLIVLFIIRLGAEIDGKEPMAEVTDAEPVMGGLPRPALDKNGAVFVFRHDSMLSTLQQSQSRFYGCRLKTENLSSQQPVKPLRAFNILQYLAFERLGRGPGDLRAQAQQEFELQRRLLGQIYRLEVENM